MGATLSIRRPLLVFLALAFPLSWYPWILSLVLGHGDGGPNPLGLLLAALIAAAVDEGWPGVRDLLLRIVRPGRSLLAFAVALLLPALTIAVAMGIASLQGVQIAPTPLEPAEMLDQFIFTLLFIGLGEEPAWRGFMLPVLQRRLHPVLATLLLAAVWAVWHVPLMGHEFAWPRVPAFLISLAGAAFVLTWLANRSGGVLLAMIMHANINTIGAGTAFHWIGANDLERFWWIYAAIWLGTGVLTIALTGGRLGMREPKVAVSSLQAIETSSDRQTANIL